MSTVLPVLDSEHPWPGLFPYGEEAHAFFNGREREATDLLRLVRRDTCTLLYGQSGLGKSSLLRAGLFPRLREEALLPVYLRLDFRSPDLALREQAWALLRDALKLARIDGRLPRADETLWEYFHAADVELWDEQNRIITPVLVFDQFEEIVQASETLALVPRLEAFLAELADLIENRIPASVTTRLEQDPDAVATIDFNANRFRCVLGFREDFLPDLEERFAAHGVNTQGRLRVTKMVEAQALAAVQKTGGDLVDRDVAERIVAFVAGAGKEGAARVLEIEPALLSVVCFELNNRRLASGEARISADLLAGAQEQIIAEFYQRSVADQDAAVAIFIERELLTESGYRDSCAVDDAVQRHGIPLTAIQKLVERRVLRLEERFGVLRVELTHDVLAPVVRANRDRRQAAEALLRERAREAERLRRTRRLLWIGGGLATLASVLVVVFFNLFRQAEAEKGRVIEAQSDLFLSQANTSLEQGIPAEPYLFLAKALELNPRNEGAIARLAGLGVNRVFARQQWAMTLNFGGSGLGNLISLDDDRFGLQRSDNALTFLGIRAAAGGKGPILECLDLAAKPGGSQLVGASLSGLTPTLVSGNARLAPMDFDFTGALDTMLAWSKKCNWKPFSNKTATFSMLGVEPDGKAVWTEDNRGLVRTLLGNGEVEILAGAEELKPWRRVEAGLRGSAVLVSGEAGSALFTRKSHTDAWQRVMQFGPQTPGAVRVVPTFDDLGRHLVLSEPDGNCSLWRTGSTIPQWRRVCDAEGHRFAPTKPWLLLRHHTTRLSLIDLETSAVRATLARPLAINHVQVSSGGEHLVVSSQDSTAVVFSLPDLTPVGVPLRHEGSVVEAQFLNDIHRVVTAAFDGAVRIWDVRSGAQIVAMVHGGPVLLARPVLGGSHVLSMSDDEVLRLWRIDPPGTAPHLIDRMLTLPTPTADGTRIAFVPAGTRHVEIAGIRSVPSTKGMLVSPQKRFDGNAAVTALAWRPGTPDRLAIATADNKISIIAADQGSVLATVALSEEARAVALTPSATHVVARLVDGTLRVHDLATGRAAGLPVQAVGSLLDWGVSQDGKWLTVAGQNGMAVHDLVTGFHVRQHKVPGALSAAVHPTRPEVAFTTRTGFGWWRPDMAASEGEKSELREEGSTTVYFGVRFSPTGQALAMYTLDGKVVTKYADGRADAPVLRHSNSVAEVSFSQDGRWLTSTTLDGRVRVWDHRSGLLMAESFKHKLPDSRFMLLGRGTWALASQGGKRQEYFAELPGLGFDRQPPAWLVPTMGGLSAMKLQAPTTAAGKSSGGDSLSAADKNEEDWWTQWLRYVAANNGIPQP